jgi:hypothetical protein
VQGDQGPIQVLRRTFCVAAKCNSFNMKKMRKHITRTCETWRVKRFVHTIDQDLEQVDSLIRADGSALRVPWTPRSGMTSGRSQNLGLSE